MTAREFRQVAAGLTGQYWFSTCVPLVGQVGNLCAFPVCVSLGTAHALSPDAHCGHPALRSLDADCAPPSWLRWSATQAPGHRQPLASLHVAQVGNLCAFPVCVSLRTAHALSPLRLFWPRPTPYGVGLGQQPHKPTGREAAGFRHLAPVVRRMNPTSSWLNGVPSGWRTSWNQTGGGAV